MDEFSHAIKAKDLSLLPGGVLIVWKWDQVQQVEEEHNSLKDDMKDSEEDATANEISEVTHTLTFKCIGSIKESRYQKALKLASELPLDDTEVILRPEPDNPYDSKAIAFVVNLGGKEHRVGYVIRELLDEVHQALNSYLIRKVKFAWVKYVVDWSKSGPGYYCGINITKKGVWSHNAVKFQSTR